MRLAEIYGDWRVVTALVMMLLGIGNWLVGLNGTTQYRRKLELLQIRPASEQYRNFDELDARSDDAVLAPLIQNQRNVSYAAAQMDFYHAVYLTGRMLFAAGVILGLLACLAAIRHDTRRAVTQRLNPL
jgi:hypothetical protein